MILISSDFFKLRFWFANDNHDHTVNKTEQKSNRLQQRPELRLYSPAFNVTVCVDMSLMSLCLQCDRLCRYVFNVSVCVDMPLLSPFCIYAFNVLCFSWKVTSFHVSLVLSQDAMSSEMSHGTLHYQAWKRHHFQMEKDDPEDLESQLYFRFHPSDCRSGLSSGVLTVWIRENNEGFLSDCRDTWTSPSC